MAILARPEELVAELAERVTGQHQISLGLTTLATELQSSEPIKGVREARRSLLHKAADLQAALADVSATVQRLRELEEILRFTELGWPGRRDEIADLCRTEPQNGLSVWLDDWFTAVAAMRIDAADRLLSVEQSLPSGIGVLLRRCRATAQAVLDRSWDVCAPLLMAGARGIDIGGQLVPRDSTRQDLWVLLVRLAVASGRTPDARSVLAEAKRDRSGPIFKALDARLALLESDDPEASADLLSLGAGSADALLEMARVLNEVSSAGSSDLSVDAGMAAARSAIAASQSLVESQQRVLRMLDPVPAEIQLALAERAVNEHDADLARQSFHLATIVGANEAVRGEAYDNLATLAGVDGDRVEERTHRLAAATAWDLASRPDRALASAELWLAVDSRDAEARCRIGLSLVQLGWTAAEADDAVDWLLRALAAIEPVEAIVESRSGQTDDLSWLRVWANNVESYAFGRLAEYQGQPMANHKWRSLLAALRAVALQTSNASLWWRLAEAASNLKLWSLAELAARECAHLTPSRENLAQHVLALINLGEMEQALEVLGDPTNPFEWNMKAHLLLHQGKAEEAAVMFAEHPAEPESDWAKLSHIATLLLVGRKADAVAMAKDLAARLRARSTESSKGILIRASVIVGDDKRVEKVAKNRQAMGEHNSDFELALVRARQGDTSESVALLRSYVAAFTTLDDVMCWRNVDREVMRVLLGDRDIAEADLSEVERELAAVRASLVTRRDPMVELDRADTRGADQSTVAAVKVLARIIVAVARDDAEGVQAGVVALTSPEAAFGKALSEWVRLRQRTKRAEAAVTSAEAGQATVAADLVRHLLEEESSDVADLLKTASPDGVSPVLLSAVCTLTGEPGVGRSANSVVQQLTEESQTPADEEAPDRPLGLVLPQSWFDGITDPATEHPLFRRHLPALRMASATFIPSVAVAVDTGLEPNGFRISLRDRLVDEGSLPLGRRLLPDGATALLPRELVETAESEVSPELRTLGTMTIPDLEDADSTFAGLLSVSALEVAVWRLEAVAASHAAELSSTDPLETHQPG